MCIFLVPPEVFDLSQTPPLPIPAAPLYVKTVLITAVCAACAVNSGGMKALTPVWGGDVMRGSQLVSRHVFRTRVRKELQRIHLEVSASVEPERRPVNE